MDGTLINSSIPIVGSINFVRNSIGLPSMDKNIILEAVNNPSITPSQLFYNSDKFLTTHTELFEKYYNEYCIKNISLYDGIKELLLELKNIAILAVATNAHKKQAIKMPDFLIT